MASIEAIVTLMPKLNIFLSVAITLEPPSRITSQNLGDFDKKCLWWGSIIAWNYNIVTVKPLSLGFTVILLMTEAVVRWCSSKQIFLKTGLQTYNFVKKRFQYRFFP